MSSLRVVVDTIVSPGDAESGRYALELTRALTETAPQGVDVEGLVSSSPQADYAHLEAELPGLAGLRKAPIDRRTMRAAWRRGLALPAPGMLHAPDLLAPLSRRVRSAASDAQAVVTVHDTLAWTDPSALPAKEAAWRRAMLRRAERFADAVVVPNHAVADALGEFGAFGERIRVVEGGPSSHIDRPADAAERAIRLGLPPEYVLTWGSGGAARSLGTVLRGFSRTDGPELPLVVFGGADVVELAHRAGLAPGRVHVVDPAGHEDRATVLHGAELLVHAGPANGFGLHIIDAMAAGVPVVHGTDAALEELTAGAALVVDRNDVLGYTASLAQHIAALLEDAQTSRRMRVSGMDRSAFFKWRDAAEKIWQLHADL